MQQTAVRIVDDRSVAVQAGYLFNEAAVTEKSVRRWPSDKLHVILAKLPMGPAARSILEGEKRRREAWQAPSGAGFWVSCIALLTSITSLAVTILSR